MNHRFLTFIVVAMLGAIHSTAGFAQQPAIAPTGQKSAAPPTPSEAAIRAESEAFVAAFNKADAKAIAAFWTEEGEYIDASGRQMVGREAIEQDYSEFFAANPNVKIQIAIDSLRFLSDSIAIEDGRAIVDPLPQGAPGVSKYTAVHTKVDGKWLMASVRETWIETPITRQSMADFEWLIGAWVAEEHGNQSESVYSWVADKSFVQRTYTTTHVDGTKTSGVQLIGWNPVQGRVQSWSFSPDGGHASGLWSPNERGWTAEMIGMTGDGTPTTSLIRIARLDDNACVWQSVQRTLGGVAIPDTDEVVIKRQTPPAASQPTER
ncbi:SnoaL-like domain protein [Rosistilla oblonga]|uniref:YybH family protein n=1 Tax=Rosistilla oblonga TaxID=2527990 RepID=UPI001188EB88|nr:SgcJ/EcaC family oxidoreductase [Rosistilla oblonga]QDV15084.1 SnoaL-like domain protein [Rosistilla oblonga]